MTGRMINGKGGGRQVESYLVDNPQWPFCKGCGHTMVIRRINDALSSLQLKPQDVALVTDIGCIGMSDGLFKEIHTVHTTHGRSTAFATGIALADAVLAEKKLKTIVLIGDGGAMIGLQHLVHAAMLNVDVTVLICNNFVYGMTGGQGSGFTPECFVTATTPDGNIVPPVDICEMLLSSNAEFVGRTIATDKDLSSMIAQAISSPGFAALEILDLCTEFAVPQNELTGKKLLAIAEENNWKIGLLRSATDRPHFGKRYLDNVPTDLQRSPKKKSIRRNLTKPIGVSDPVSLMIAGSAGEKVQSAAATLCQAAVASGLQTTQKNDNPVTQGSGFSLAEIWLSIEEVGFTGIDRPDYLVITSPEGYRELTDRGVIARLNSNTKVYVDESVGAAIEKGVPKIFPYRKAFGPELAALAAIVHVARLHRLVDREALDTVVQGRLKDAAPKFAQSIEELTGRSERT